MGGAEVHALHLAEGLQRSGRFEVAAALRPGELAERFRASGLTAFPMAFGDGIDSITPIRLAWLATGFDLIHAHMNRAALMTRIAGWISGRPWVATAHGMTRGSYYRGADRVIAVSAAVRDHLLPQGVHPITVVRNALPEPEPVPVERIREFRSRVAPGPRDRIALVLASHHPNKGIDLAVEAVRRLGPEWRLVVMGNDVTGSGLEALARQPDLAGRLWLEPVWSPAGSALAAADVVMVPSRREAFSLVAAEARMRGVPVLAADVDGLREVVPEGAPGCLRVAGRDPGRWAEALREMGEGIAVLRERARRAAGRACREFALGPWVERTADVYRSVLLAARTIPARSPGKPVPSAGFSAPGADPGSWRGG